MCGDSRAKDNTALGACCRCQAERSSTNPERSTCLQSTTLQLVQPSASFLPASFDAKRHLVNTRPRTHVADFAPRGRATADRSMSACQKATFDGYHDGKAHCALLTQSLRFPLANRRRPRRQDGTMTSAAMRRIWSDVGIHWCANNRAGAKRLQSCTATRRSTQNSRTYGAKVGGRGDYEEKRWALWRTQLTVRGGTERGRQHWFL